MESTITATELARRLSDVLNRVRYRGERFVVQRNGEPVATLAPAGPPPGITWAELMVQLRDLPRPDEGFTDDLEAIQSAQGPARFPEWPN